jgi:hypothetical protein
LTTEQGQNDVPETHIDPGSWDELVAWLFRFSASIRIYRGQRDYSWTLRTRLARDLEKLPTSVIRLSVENSAIGFFMDQAAGLLPNVPDEHDLLGWLALMQHYGAPTRLLDWSQSPFVATYFAYEQASDDDSALYALDPYFCRRQFVGSLIPMPWDHTGTLAHSTTDKEGSTTTAYPGRTQYRRDRENDLLRWSITHSSGWPLPTIPFGQDARMTAQQTIFTLAGDVEKVIDDLFDKEKWPSPVERMPGGFIVGTDSTVWPLVHPGQLLTKIRLRSQWRGEALKALDKMGLTAASLFPGLDGLGRATSLHVEAGLSALRDVLTGFSPA